MGLGIAITTNAQLGTTPISSLPLVFSYLCGTTLGICTLTINIALFLVQVPLLGKHFTRKQFLQLPGLVVFSACLDLGMWLSQTLIPDLWLSRACMSVLGCMIMAFGIMLEVLSGTTVLPGEGIVLAITWRFHKNFGNTKVLFDTSLVLFAALLGWACTGALVGIREGTLATALLGGVFVRTLGQHCAPGVNSWLEHGFRRRQ